MASSLVFLGPDGPYQLILADRGRGFEDTTIQVRRNGAITEWHVETEAVDPSGPSILSGMTRDGSGLWFELQLSKPPKLRLWGNQVLLRIDQPIE